MACDVERNDMYVELRDSESIENDRPQCGHVRGKPWIAMDLE